MYRPELSSHPQLALPPSTQQQERERCHGPVPQPRGFAHGGPAPRQNLPRAPQLSPDTQPGCAQFVTLYAHKEVGKTSGVAVCPRFGPRPSLHQLGGREQGMLWGAVPLCQREGPSEGIGEAGCEEKIKTLCFNKLWQRQKQQLSVFSLEDSFPLGGSMCLRLPATAPLPSTLCPRSAIAGLIFQKILHKQLKC